MHVVNALAPDGLARLVAPLGALSSSNPPRLAGLGTLMLTAIGNRDYAIVQAGLMLLVAVFILVNLGTDIAYGFLDPRIRYSARRG
jgi:ABC-type microcin C transport system permease subunit YejB